MPKASENSVLLSMSRGRAEQTLGIPPLPQHGAGATWLQHEQMWRQSDAWGSCGGKGPSADHVYPLASREITMVCYTLFLTSNLNHRSRK